MVPIAIVKYFGILMDDRKTERFDMSQLAPAFSAIRRLIHGRSSPRECEPDRPVSFAELAAASAFLDFGGMPSGDWLHAWEASIESDRRLTDDERPPATAVPTGRPGNKRIDESLDGEKTVFHPRPSQHAACDLTGRGAFPFRSQDGAPMLLVDRLSGYLHMRADGESRTPDLAMCVAAFGFIAGVLVFAHPTLPTSRAASATTVEPAIAATTSTQIGTALSQLAAPR
jgi:hypothetical protein